MRTAFIALATLVAGQEYVDEDVDVFVRLLSGASNSSNTTGSSSASSGSAAASSSASASASSQQSAANTTTTAPTTVAPFDVGSWEIRYYNNSACSGGANPFDISGPLGGCLNTTAHGTGNSATYKTAVVTQCSSTFTMKVNMAAETCPDEGMTPVGNIPVNMCLASSTVAGMYYQAACSSAAYSGPASHTITTTAAPFDDGNWSIKYYNNSACEGADSPFNIDGPLSGCLNTTAHGTANSATYKTAVVTQCGATFTMKVNMAAESCPAEGMTPVGNIPTNICLASSTVAGMYYKAACSATAWSGASALTITPAPKTEAPVTDAPATDAPATDAPSQAQGEETETSSNATTTTMAPAEAEVVVKVSASYEAVEDLPANVTADDLLSSTLYVGAKQTGVAAALGVSASKVTVDGFVISTSRQLTGRSLASTTVVTEYTVETTQAESASVQAAVADDDVAAAIQTETTTAMAAIPAAQWAAEPVLTAAPAITVTSVSFVGVATVAPTAGGSTSSGAIQTGLSVVALLVSFSLF